MSEAAAVHPAHQFDDLHQQHDAMTLGMWLFLVTEVMFFGGLFAAYAVYRSRAPQAFAEASHTLDVVLGTVNTAVLLISSFTVVLSVHAAQTKRQRAIVILLSLTLLLGLVFLGIKALEYAEKSHERHVPGPQFHWESSQHGGADPGHVEMFFALYFAMTGVHAAHMVVGIGIFAVLLALALRGRFAAGEYMPLEIAGLYWHFVDIIWVFLFPLLYLIA